MSSSEPGAAAAGAEGVETPEWLDESFAEAALAAEGGGRVRVRRLSVRRAVPKGENYASLLLRVTVHYTDDDEGANEKTASLIVKTLPRGEIMRGWLEEAGVFPRERRMYTETLPRLEALLGGGEPWAARSLPCARADSLVLRDLCPDGFRMSSRRAGLDRAHTSLVLRALARLHAASVALHERDPEHVESYTEVFYAKEKREHLEKFLPKMLEGLAATMESWGGDSVGHAQRLRAFLPTALDAVIEASTPSDTFLNVLNHGDCWVNNCLFRYPEDAADGAAPADMRFVDFQIMRYTSPSLDLQYFLYTSVQPSVREEHWRELLEEYAGALAASLETLGLADRAVDADALQRDMAARSAFGVVAACCVLFAVVADPGDALDMDNITQEQLDKGELPFDKALQGDNYKKALQRLMPHFVERGYL